MKIRAVVIGRPPPDRSTGGFPVLWTVAAVGKADVQVDVARPVVHQILSGVEQLEWRHALKERAADLKEARIDPGKYEGVDPASVSRAMRGMRPERKSPGDWRLQDLAGAVVTRATVFCLSAPRDEACIRLMSKIVSELKDYPPDKLIGSNGSITFAPLDDSPESAASMERFVAQAVEACTSFDLSHFDVRREGPVLLLGPTGSGKTELARHLHRRWGFKPETFMKVNIGAISETLIESRLRGHKRGAFTDAKEERAGWFDVADKGTLFLDEFQNASDAVQVQLLDLLSATSDDVEVAPIGADRAKVRRRVKVILAANKPLQELLRNEKLRPDLFQRVRIVQAIRSLADRLNSPEPGEPDADTLLKRLLAIYRWKSNRPVMTRNGGVVADDDPAEIDHLFPYANDDILRAFKSHPWHGNLRELERVCFDIYWRLETSTPPDMDFVRRQLDRLGMSQASSGLDTPLMPPQSAEMARLRHVEEILLRHELDLDSAALDLAKIRRKTPQLLRDYLRENKPQLSAAFLRHPRAALLLQRRPRKSRKQPKLG